MKMSIAVTVVLFLCMVLLFGFLYVNPRYTPSFLKGKMPTVYWPKAQSPMSNFRPPQFGPGAK